jgi:hypothetical protein
MLALFSGLLRVILLSNAADAALHAAGVLPPFGQPMRDALFGLATAYRMVYAVTGSWIAVQLAPDRPGGKLQGLSWRL